MAHHVDSFHQELSDRYPDLDLLRTEAGRWALARRVEWWVLDPSLTLMDEERQRLDVALLSALALIVGDPDSYYQNDVTEHPWPWDASDGRIPMLVGVLTDTPPHGWIAATERDEDGTLLGLLVESWKPGTVVHPPPQAQVSYLLAQRADYCEREHAQDSDEDEIAEANEETFLFHGLAVRVIWENAQPWIVAADIAKGLGYRNASDMTRKIDDDEKGTRFVRTPSGLQKMTVLNEPGLYAVLQRSTRPEAKRFAKWVNHEVLPALRERGTYSLSGRPGTDVTIVTNPETPTQRDPQLWRLALDTVTQVRQIYGRRQARNVYAQLGLPDVSRARPVGVNAIADAQACLDHLLLTVTVSGEQIGAMIGRALGSGHAATKAKLAGLGIRVLTRRDGAATAVFLGTGMPALQRIFDGTAWDQGRWRDALCLLPGIERGTPMRIHGRSTRTIAVPARLIEAALADPVTPRPADPILGPAGPLTLEHA